MTRGPSAAQRIALSVLAGGGWIYPGRPGVSCPRLIERDGRLFSLIARGTLDVLRAQCWVMYGVGPTGRTHYVVTYAGRLTARRFRP